MHTWSTSSTPANLILYIVCQPLPKGKKGTWYEQVKDLAPIIGTFGNTRNYLGVTVKKRNYLGVAEGTKCMQGTSTSHQPIACNGCSENGAVMCRSRSITSPTFYSEMPSPQWINMARMTHLFCKCRAWEERCPCLQSRAIQCGHCALLRFKRTDEPWS